MNRRFWEPLLEVWHVDPETDGSESSCQHRLERKTGDRIHVHTCWRFWHWRFRSPLIRTLVRWIRGRCGLCGEHFKMFEGVCGHLGSSKHTYHPKCFDIVSKRLHRAMYHRWGCQFMFGDGKPCESIANYMLEVMERDDHVRRVRRCFRHVPAKADREPIRMHSIRVNGM